MGFVSHSLDKSELCFETKYYIIIIYQNNKQRRNIVLIMNKVHYMKLYEEKLKQHSYKKIAFAWNSGNIL